MTDSYLVRTNELFIAAFLEGSDSEEEAWAKYDSGEHGPEVEVERSWKDATMEEADE